MTLSDADQLRGLLQRYARAVDSRDMEALRALFHPEAVIDGVRGRQDLAGWLEAMSGPRTFPGSMHVLGDPVIRLDGDVAELDTYAVVYQIDSGHPKLTVGIRYLDEAVRRDGEWLIRGRRAETLWTAAPGAG